MLAISSPNPASPHPEVRECINHHFRDLRKYRSTLPSYVATTSCFKSLGVKFRGERLPLAFSLRGRLHMAEPNEARLFAYRGAPRFQHAKGSEWDPATLRAIKNASGALTPSQFEQLDQFLNALHERRLQALETQGKDSRLAEDLNTLGIFCYVLLAARPPETSPRFNQWSQAVAGYNLRAASALEAVDEQLAKSKALPTSVPPATMETVTSVAARYLDPAGDLARRIGNFDPHSAKDPVVRKGLRDAIARLGPDTTAEIDLFITSLDVAREKAAAAQLARLAQSLTSAGRQVYEMLTSMPPTNDPALATWVENFSAFTRALSAEINKVHETPADKTLPGDISSESRTAMMTAHANAMAPHARQIISADHRRSQSTNTILTPTTRRNLGFSEAVPPTSAPTLASSTESRLSQSASSMMSPGTQRRLDLKKTQEEKRLKTRKSALSPKSEHQKQTQSPQTKKSQKKDLSS
jgi:hypothetical protein